MAYYPQKIFRISGEKFLLQWSLIIQTNIVILVPRYPPKNRVFPQGVIYPQFGNHCSNISVKHIWNRITSTSSCIREEEGKYIIICINRYHIFATNVSNSDSPSQRFFHAFRQAKLSKSFSQFRTAVTSDFNARATDTAEIRWKAVLSFLYKSFDVCISPVSK